MSLFDPDNSPLWWCERASDQLCVKSGGHINLLAKTLIEVKWPEWPDFDPLSGVHRNEYVYILLIVQSRLEPGGGGRGGGGGGGAAAGGGALVVEPSCVREFVSS